MSFLTKDEGTIETKIIKSFMDEQRTSRIWGYTFKFSFLIYLFITSYMYMFVFDTSAPSIENKHIGVIDINGAIGDGAPVDYRALVPSIKAAFEAENSVAVVLNANSPGGSPAHSDVIYRELKHYKSQYPEKPLYVVVDDVCASGCIFIASAADEILVNRTSMLGSIGVKMQGFGFVGIMEKFGVERREISAGEHKTLMDPFSPRDLFAENHLAQSIIAKTHERFIEVVKEGRGDALDQEQDIFNGLVWSGQDAIDIGLADRIGTIYEVTREFDEIEDQSLHNYTNRPFSFKNFIVGASLSLFDSLAARNDLNVTY